MSLEDCWSPKGFRPDIPSQIIREYTYTYGAVCPFDGDSCYLILPRMDADCMDVFLQEISMRYAADSCPARADRGVWGKSTLLPSTKNCLASPPNF